MFKPQKVQAQLNFLKQLSHLTGDFVVSGGLAWHLLSKPHVESKDLHDHHDIDLFISKTQTIPLIRSLVPYKIPTPYPNTYRFSKTVEVDGVRVKLLVDVFVVNPLPQHLKINGIKVVKPNVLIGFYHRKIHRNSQIQRCLSMLRSPLCFHPMEAIDLPWSSRVGTCLLCGEKVEVI